MIRSVCVIAFGPETPCSDTKARTTTGAGGRHTHTHTPTGRRAKDRLAVAHHSPNAACRASEPGEADGMDLESTDDAQPREQSPSPPPSGGPPRQVSAKAPLFETPRSGPGRSPRLHRNTGATPIPDRSASLSRSPRRQARPPCTISPILQRHLPKTWLLPPLPPCAAGWSLALIGRSKWSDKSTWKSRSATLRALSVCMRPGSRGPVRGKWRGAEPQREGGQRSRSARRRHLGRRQDLRTRAPSLVQRAAATRSLMTPMCCGWSPRAQRPAHGSKSYRLCSQQWELEGGSRARSSTHSACLAQWAEA